jgi:hypothetical protein
VPPFRGYEHGFTIWARFAACDAAVVDAIPLANLELPAGEADRLFADARPIDGFERLRRPAPHHVLLILAHNFLDAGDGEVPLSAGRRRRVMGALAEDEDALERARSLAPAWRRVDRLARLESAFALGEVPRRDGGPPERRPGARAALNRLRRYRRAWRRGHVVAISGADEQLRRVQAEALARALQSLDIAVEVVRPHAAPGGGAGTARPTSAALALAAAHRRAVVPALERGAVVISDGYALDAVVALRTRYGGRRSLALETALIRALSPRPRRAYLIGTDATGAGPYAGVASVLQVRALDVAQGQERLCSEIASDVWPAVR